MKPRRCRAPSRSNRSPISFKIFIELSEPTGTTIAPAARASTVRPGAQGPPWQDRTCVVAEAPLEAPSASSSVAVGLELHTGERRRRSSSARSEQEVSQNSSASIRLPPPAHAPAPPRPGSRIGANESRGSLSFGLAPGACLHAPDRRESRPGAAQLGGSGATLARSRATSGPCNPSTDVTWFGPVTGAAPGLREFSPARLRSERARVRGDVGSFPGRAAGRSQAAHGQLAGPHELDHAHRGSLRRQPLRHAEGDSPTGNWRSADSIKARRPSRWPT